MNELFYSSKGEIRNRILSNARDHWGLNHIDNLDPMVKLLLETLCVELFNVSNELKDLELRVIEKLAETLAVEAITGALPAHAMLRAKPIENSELLDENDSFVHQLRRTHERDSASEFLEFAFNPIYPIRVFNASICAMATGNKLFQVDDSGIRSLVAELNHSPRLCQNMLYIGLKCSPDSDNLRGMSFYLDWPYYNVGQSTLQLLALGEWSIGGQPLKMKQGRPRFMDTLSGEDKGNLKSTLNGVAYIDAFYRNRYFTLDTDVHLSDFTQTVFPPALGIFSNMQSSSLFSEPLVWIKLDLPAAIDQQALDELAVNINAFPVVNRKLQQLKYRLKGINDIIPIKTDDKEQFLEVKSLSDLKGNSYSEIPQGRDESRNEGLYSVRYGGTERFDSRNAKDMLDYLFEVLRDQRAAFANYGTDFLHTTLGELEKQLSLLASRIEQTEISSSGLVNYIVYKPLPNAEMMFLDYWTTNAALANGIKTGTPMRASNGAKMAVGSIFLLSSTVGGRDRLKSVNRTRAYKYGLMTANRIVTQMDLENFCWLEFGDYISEIKLSPGIYDSKNPKQGFVRTVDITLTPQPNHLLGANEWKSLLEIGLAKLKGLSVMTAHFRLFVNSQEVAV